MKVLSTLTLTEASGSHYAHFECLAPELAEQTFYRTWAGAADE